MSAPAPGMVRHEAMAVLERLQLNKGKTNLDTFSETVLALARENRNVVVVTSDSRGSGKLVPFAAELPKQIVEVGIAEQNLVGVAAGLASAGKIPYAVSPACFVTARSLEQIKNDVCYSNNPVKVIGISSGVSYGALGTTHHSLHDLAVLRAINNIDIVVPADNFESAQAIKAAAAQTRPIYIRFGKAPMHDLPRTSDEFVVGKARVIREGTDVAFVATGETVIHALLAAEQLKSTGVSARVVSMHSIRPLDVDVVLESARTCAAIVTVEEHMTAGGLGDACASVILEAGVSVGFKQVGIPDEYTITGSQADIFRHYRISMEGLADVAMSILASRGLSTTRN